MVMIMAISLDLNKGLSEAGYYDQTEKSHIRWLFQISVILEASCDQPRGSHVKFWAFVLVLQGQILDFQL